VPRWTVEELGRRPYVEVLALQHARVAARQRQEIVDTLLLVEHDDVVTLGRRRDARDNVRSGNPLPVVEIERGGDATYHGPGQLVAYPIVQLEGAERDLHAYLRHLEEAVMRTCEELGLVAERKAGWTGVWIGDHKVASIGIAVRRWVTFHGLALNVATDLDKFAHLSPCGLDAQVMTSLSVALGRPVAMAEASAALVLHLGEVLGRSR
jgi:lipoyl(octanoyl) transferase